MTPEQWQAVRACFDGALRQAPRARRNWLLQATGSDESVRLQVEKLLASDDRPDERLEQASRHLGLNVLVPPEPEHSTLGRYHIVAVLGEGRSGIVYRARDADRDVALKLLKASVWSHASSRRFRTEIRALALLRHENIAQIYEAGTLPEAGGAVRPYFSMELVEGQPIHLYADRANLGFADRVRLIVQLCEAVQTAHQRGVIHRDLKPGNVLVEDHPAGRAMVKVIDFGIARLLESDDSLTQTGQALGTPGYMSPEQMSGDPQAVDTRSDIFAIGALLHHLLLGVPPGIPGDRPAASLPRDLGTVLGRAIERDPNRRFGSAAEFGAELQRVLEHRPINTRRPGIAYVATMFLRRHPALAVAVGAAFMAVIAALAVFGFASYRIAESERETVVAQRVLLREVAGTLINLVGGSKDEARVLMSLLPQFESFVKRHPDDESAREDLALLLGRLGDNCSAAGDHRTGLDLWNRALALRETLAHSAEQRALLSTAIVRTGDLRGETGDRAGRILAYRRSLEMDRASFQEHPENDRCASNFLYSLNRASNLAIQDGELAAAEGLALEQLELAELIAARSHDSAQARLDLAFAFGWLAECRRRMLRFASTTSLVERQLDILESLLADAPLNRGLRLSRISAALSLLGTPGRLYTPQDDRLFESLSLDLDRMIEADPGDQSLREHRLLVAVARAEHSKGCIAPPELLVLAGQSSSLLGSFTGNDGIVLNAMRIRTLQHVSTALAMMGCFGQARAWGDASKDIALRTAGASVDNDVKSIPALVSLLDEGGAQDMRASDLVIASRSRGQWNLRLRIAAWALDNGHTDMASDILSAVSAELCVDCLEAREQVESLTSRLGTHNEMPQR